MGPAVRIFLSFNSRDRALAFEVREKLLNLQPDADIFFAPDSLSQGLWMPKLADRIRMAEGFLLLLGPNGVGAWQTIEFYEAFERHVREPAFALVPLIVAGGHASGLCFLRQLNWIELPGPLDDKGLHRVWAALKRESEPAGSVPWRLVHPYRGLEAMTEANADYFFGREAETNTVLSLLAAKPGRLPLLIGASGVGKSSIAHAGVLSALKAMHLPPAIDSLSAAWPEAFRRSRCNWAWLVVRPGDDPLKELAAAFTRLWKSAVDPERWPLVRKWADGLRADNTLSDLIEATQEALEARDGVKPERILIYLDQGEELYTRAARSAPKDAARFSTLLAEGLNDPRLIAFGSLRADYFDRLQADDALFAVHEHVNVRSLTRTQLHDVVTGAPSSLGVVFDDDKLPSGIAKAAGEKPGALPLLSYLLTDMWSAMLKRGDGVLRLPADAIDIGSVLAARAEEFLRLTSHEGTQPFGGLAPLSTTVKKKRGRWRQPQDSDPFDSDPFDSEPLASDPFNPALSPRAGRKGALRPTKKHVSSHAFRANPTAEAPLKRLLTLRLALVPAEGEPVRRPALKSECTAEEWEVAEKLAEHPWRLVVAGERETDGQIGAEVAHEALLRAWPRLEGWLRDERDFLVFKSDVERAERRWRDMGRDDKALLTGLDLNRAEEWLPRRGDDLSVGVREFVSASVALNHATRTSALRYRRLVSGGAVLAALILAAAVGVAVVKWQDAELQALKATNAVEVVELLSDRVKNEGSGEQLDRHLFERMNRAAVAGNPIAANKLGLLAALGRGTERDYARAREWWEQAAAKGDASAMFNLGWLHHAGHDVPQDDGKAREWYEKAAAKDDADAMVNLGLLYNNGQGVPQDYAKAREWYEKAAAKGDATAMVGLGQLYHDGKGEWNWDKAREWYERAAARDDGEAMRLLGLLYEKAEGVPQQDYAKAREWYEKAAARDDGEAMRLLGLLYENGKGMLQDYAKAREWYEKAAARNDGEAMRLLGLLYDNGRGVPQDYRNAWGWYEKAAANGAITGNRLGDDGQDVSQRYANARQWYEKAMATDDADAMMNIGRLYRDGRGVPQDYGKAREWFEKAAAKDDADAMANLGLLYDNGQGVPQDYAKAREWYGKAAAGGNSDAMHLIGVLDAMRGVLDAMRLIVDFREWYERVAAMDDGAAPAAGPTARHPRRRDRRQLGPRRLSPRPGPRPHPGRREEPVRQAVYDRSVGQRRRDDAGPRQSADPGNDSQGQRPGQDLRGAGRRSGWR
jgi:TPR repeat protein